MDLVDETLRLCDALTAEGIEYAVCGGIALAIHGFVRFTKDIDILVREEDLERALVVARSCGFSLEGGRLNFRVGTPEHRAVFRVSKARGSIVLTLDLLLVPSADEGVWSGRQVAAFADRKITVVSREGLIAMKRLAGRPQDLVDIQRLGEALEGREHGQDP